MSRSILDARQVAIRSFLEQLASRAHHEGTSDAKPANQTEIDNLLESLNSELTTPLRMTASNPADLVVNVGSAIIVNPENNRSRSIPHIGSLLPNSFASGTVTFPASSGGNITNSTNANTVVLTVATSEYIKVLIYMDTIGDLNVLTGVANAVEASATVLPAPSGTLPIGYITLFNNAGTIDNIVQAKIYQFTSLNDQKVSADGSIDTHSDVNFPVTAINNDVLTFNSGTGDWEALAAQAAVSNDPKRNYLINGNFEVSQRGSSVITNLTPGSNYGADRFCQLGGTVNCEHLISSSGPPVGSSTFLRLTPQGGGSISIGQFIETKNLIGLHGKTVTFSMLIRRNATWSESISLIIGKNSTTDAGPVTASWTNFGQEIVPVGSIPTGTTSSDWLRVNLTVSIPDDGTANGLRCYIADNVAVPFGSYLEIAQVMLVEGSEILPFQRMGTDFQNEFDICKRYFNTFNRGLNGQSITASNMSMGCTFDVEMRVNPSASWASLPTIHMPGVNFFTPANTNFASLQPSAKGVHFEMNSFSGMATGNEIWWWSGGSLIADAEL